MVKTYESWFSPSPNLYKVIRSFEKFDQTDLFLQMHVVYTPHTKLTGLTGNKTGQQLRRRLQPVITRDTSHNWLKSD